MQKQISEAEVFFKPHIPRFAKVLLRHPKLFVALHNGVKSGEIDVPSLKRVGAKFIALDKAHQKRFHRVLKTASWLAEKNKVASAVELMNEHVQAPHKFGLRDILRVKRKAITTKVLDKLLFGFQVPDKHALVQVSQDLPVLKHPQHGGLGKFELIVHGENLIVKTPDGKQHGGTPGLKFTIGPSVFQFISSQRNGFAIRGASGPAKGKVYLFNARRGTIGPSQNDHIQLVNQ